mmetsp:Transcript_33631/g.81505  ORF Transcript_33631/g.81505 Transcript_33631/m.81505 type:complete len:272 (+) Transcript_33631:450-1265(+)
MILTESLVSSSHAFIDACIQNFLKFLLVPSTKVIGVIDTAHIRKGVPATTVWHDAEDKDDLRQADWVSRRTCSFNVAIQSIGNVALVVGTVNIDTIPASWKIHSDFQLFTSSVWEESILGVASFSSFTRGWIDTGCFCINKLAGCSRIGSSNHLESIGESLDTSIAGPNVIGRSLGNLIFGVCVGIFVVGVGSRVPIKRLVLLNISRVDFIRTVSQVFVGSLWSDYLRTIKGMDMIRETCIGDNRIRSCHGCRKKVHLDTGSRYLMMGIGE